MTFSPTPEQLAIIEAARGTTDNLMVEALAGAAKTTTLELICKAVTGIPILSLAFNKRIADEMTKRLPSHVVCKTFNALGHGVWSKQINRRLVVNTKKSYEILKALVDEMPKDQRREAYDSFAENLRWIATAKRLGYIPPRLGGLGGRPLASELLSEEGDKPEDIDLIDEALKRSIEASFAGAIDFDDQLYMPVLFGGSWPRFPLVLVDEAQDLSPLNHAMLQKLVTKRLIVVGDPWQSIYGFRGAVASGMSSLRDQFNCKTLRLSISFRCPRAVVLKARARVPHMCWPDWAEEGIVQTLRPVWSAESVPDGAAIICRNNAPLFSMALRLLEAGRGIKLIGFEIGPTLVKLMKTFGPLDLTTMAAREALGIWSATELRRGKKSASSIADRVECIDVFLSKGNTLGEAIAYAEALFKQDGPILLMSGHKSKGLEYDVVIHLDPWRIPSKFAIEAGGEAIEQELNLRYVITTRAKRALYEADLQTFNGAL